MKVLITGGSGFLGINLIRYLLRKSGQIKSLDIEDFNYPEYDQINAIKGDIRNEKTVEKAMHGVDIVVNCAAALPLYPKEEIFSTNVKGTRIVLEKALQKGIERVIHISTTAVYGIPDHHPLKEDDELNGVGAYGESKVLAEKVCLEYTGKGMCVPILRPKSFVGPERLGAFALLYDWAKDGKGFPVMGSGNNRYQLLDVEDLCEATYMCMTRDKKTANDIYNIGAKDFTTMKEDFQAILDEAGFNKKVVGFPAGPVVTALRILEFFNLSPLYKWIYETAYKDSFVSIEKAERKLGFTPKYSNKEALIRNFRWYLDNLENFKNQLGVSHRVPWKQGILRLAKIFF